MAHKRFNNNSSKQNVSSSDSLIELYSLKQYKSIFQKNNDLKEFCIKFGRKILAMREYTQDYNHLDPFAKILCDGEMCVAVSIVNGCLVIASNRQTYIEKPNSFQITKCLYAVRSEGNFIIEAKYFIENMNGGTTEVSSTNKISYKKTLKNTLAPTEPTKQKFTLSFLPNPEDKYIFQQYYSTFPAASFSCKLKEIKQTKSTLVYSYTSEKKIGQDPLEFRVELLVSYIKEIVDMRNGNGVVDYDVGRKNLMSNCLFWKITKSNVQSYEGSKPLINFCSSVIHKFNQLEWDPRDFKTQISTFYDGQVKPMLNSELNQTILSESFSEIIKDFLYNLLMVEDFVINNHNLFSTGVRYRIENDDQDGVHAETRIMHFLKKNNFESNVEQNLQIGISKLCCNHCVLVMKSNNFTNFTGGSGLTFPNIQIPDFFLNGNQILSFLGDLHPLYLSLGDEIVDIPNINIKKIKKKKICISIISQIFNLFEDKLNNIK